MNVTEMTTAIVQLYATRRPCMVWGAPGLGKSTGVKEAARILGEMDHNKVERKGKASKAEPFGFIDLRLSLREPSDLLGVYWPDVTKGEVRNMHASFLPRSGRGILFLDEFVQGTQLMQGAASQLVLDRCVGEYQLPDGWYVMAAGNRMSDKSATNSMPMHIRNRFIHLYADVDADSWIRWALDNGIDTRVIAFVKFQQKLLHQFDPQAKGEAFPTPRSWEVVSDVLKSWTGDRALLETLIRGTVGDGVGTMFCGFLRVADKLPSIDGILLNPKTAPIPDDLGALHATCTALGSRATKDNLAAISLYLQRIATEKQKPDFAVYALKEFSSRRDAGVLTTTRAFIELSSKFNHLMS